VGRAKDGVARARETETMATAVVLGAGALHPACALEGRHELRHGSAGYTRAAGEIRSAQRLGRDRTKSRELAEGQRRFMPGQEPLDPAAGEGGDADQGFGRGFPVTRTWHS